MRAPLPGRARRAPGGRPSAPRPCALAEAGPGPGDPGAPGRFALLYPGAGSFRTLPGKARRAGGLLAGWCITYSWPGDCAHAPFREARNAALLKRFGTSDTDAIAAMADTYYKLCAARDAAQAEAERQDCHRRRPVCLPQLQRAGDSAGGPPLRPRRLRHLPRRTACCASCAVRRKELAEAESAAREARLRADLLARAGPQAGGRRSVRSAGAEPGGCDRPTGAGPGGPGRRPLRRGSADRPAPRRGRPGGAASVRAEQLEQREQLEEEYAALQLAWRPWTPPTPLCRAAFPRLWAAGQRRSFRPHRRAL